MIVEDYVSPETAMLLKEKGFDGYCDLCFNFIEIPRRIVNVPSDGKVSYEDGILKEEIVLIPTLQMAMKWLREKEIFVEVTHILFYSSRKYQYIIFRAEPEFYTAGDEYESYEEACEVAIKYCLENLI